MADTTVEFVVYVDGHPKYSGSKAGALFHANEAMRKAHAEGRPEPLITYKSREVIRGNEVIDAETGETTATQDVVKETKVEF